MIGNQMFLIAVSMHGWKGLEISNKYVHSSVECCHSPFPSTTTSKWKAM